MSLNVSAVMYTSAPASYDGLPATPVACPYATRDGAALRKVIVPSRDFASQMNAYLKAQDSVTFPETQLEKYMSSGYVQRCDVSVAAQEVLKRNTRAGVATPADTHTQESAMPAGAAKSPRTKNTVRTVTKRNNATIIVDAPANLPVPHVAALDGMTPLGVPANDAPAALAPPAAIDTPAEQAAASPKRKRANKKAAPEQAPAPAPAQLDAAPQPEAIADPEPAPVPEPAPEAAPEIPTMHAQVDALPVPFVTDNPGEQVAYILKLQALGGDAALVYAINRKFVRVGTVVQPGKAKKVASASPIRESTMRPDKLTRETADAIRAMHAKGGLTQKQLAEHFGVTRLFAWEVLNHVRLTDTPNPKYAYSRTGK